NRLYIKSNGIAVFVNRDLEKLSRAGRPLSLDIATVKKLFEERKEIYKEISNFSVSNNGEINDTVNEIIAKF
ncbi:MAG: shikimate kinase, partial [Clostridia bacterium]